MQITYPLHMHEKPGDGMDPSETNLNTININYLSQKWHHNICTYWTRKRKKKKNKWSKRMA